MYGLLGVWEVLGHCVLIAYDTHEAEWLELRLDGSMNLRILVIGI